MARSRSNSASNSASGGFEFERYQVDAPPLGAGYRAINDNDEILIMQRWTKYETPKAPGVTYGVYLMNGGGHATYHYRSVLRTASGDRELVHTQVTDRQVGSRHDAVDVNDAGETIGVLGEYVGDTVFESPVLWSRNGVATDLRTLFPPNYPTEGSWIPEKIAGRYILLRHRVNSTGVDDYYLFYRGAS